MFNRLRRLAAGWAPGVLLAAGLLGLSGCGRDEIKTYRVPKEAAAPIAAAHPAGEAPQVHLHWDLPEGWQEQPAGRMRAASFGVSGPEGQSADVAVIPLPGVVGRDMEIVNLWREQVRLDPINEPEMHQQAQPVVIGELRGKLFEMVSREPIIEGKHAARILVAMLEREGTSWFFKMTGSDALVQGQRDAFLNFLRSVAFHAGSHTGEVAEQSPVGGQRAGVPGDGSGSKPEWSVPPHWQEQPPTAMVKAMFSVTDGGAGRAEISVSAFPGDVGGVLANVNRWRRQINLPPVDAQALKELVRPIDPGMPDAILVDMTGPPEGGGTATRLMTAIVPRGGETWFYKMTGPEPVVAREQAAFVRFVQTVKYPHANH